MIRYAVVLAVAAATLAVGGCGGSATEPGAPPQTRAAEPEETMTDQPSAGPDQGVVTVAVHDLARRLEIGTDEISVVSVEEVTWRDGSIGCPKPGMMYPQVLTDGSRVVLETGGQRYEYHAGGRRTAFLCDDPQPPARR
ncbi:MAG: hypothetical protein ACRDOJ_08345 [Nocardioidaceae bacterium]